MRRGPCRAGDAGSSGVHLSEEPSAPSAGRRAAGGGERAEQARVPAVRLGVPLHPDREPAGRAVRSPRPSRPRPRPRAAAPRRAGRPPGGGSSARPPCGAEDRAEAAVAAVPVRLRRRRSRGPAGGRCGPTPVRQVLDQGAAQGDVEHLHAAAHAEHRDVAGQRGGEQRELPGIPGGRGRTGQRVRRLPYRAGVDVRAAGQQQAVERRDGRGRRRAPAGAAATGRPPAPATPST